MSQPPKGHYRSIIGRKFPDVRIAFTHTPIHGCTVIDSSSVLTMLDSSDDSYAAFYSNGIRNGQLVTIVENNVAGYYKNNGELFFTT